MTNPEICMAEAEVREHLDAMAETLARRLAGHPLVLVGIREGGDVIAERLAPKLAERGLEVRGVGALDVTLYRDDFGHRRHWPDVRSSEIPVPIDDCTVVLTDDVLFTGRTVRAALNALLDYGRPEQVTLAVLVDRGHRQLPITADVVGRRLELERDVLCEVRFREQGAESDRVVLEGAA